MTQLCGRCQRANPKEANYCYFDGFVLAGHGGAGGPVAIGSQAFLNAFVFPSGRSCRSFNELALACQEEWNGAADLLKQGFFESFLGSIGRIDLAMAAKEASKFPDKDRALDQILSKLPSDTLEDPKLRFEPQEINLGILTGDAVQRIELQLENQGMRLLHGSLSTEAPWLVLGEGSASREKHFQCRNEQKIPIRINLDFLRAGPKPVEAKLAVETNGGSAVIHVRAERPVKPYPSGVFAGAKTPRQIAEKAKPIPKEVAPLFERGDVAAWYKSNGWTYPVQGPSASGMGAIQQFFEALGLVQPPKVEISVKSLRLGGKTGDLLTATVEVKTQEKKPVYAHGESDQGWLVASRAKLNGRTATIDLTVMVPDSPGEELTARLTVQANGQQRFVIPVKLKIEGEKVASNRRKPAPATQPAMDLGPEDNNPFAGMGSESALITPVLSSVAVAEPQTQRRTTPASGAAVATLPATQVETATQTTVSGAARYRKKKETPAWVHLIPAIVLGLAVVAFITFDLVTRKVVMAQGAKDDKDLKEIEALLQNQADTHPSDSKWPEYRLADKKPRLNIKFGPLGTFGLTTVPNANDNRKTLTSQEDGHYNNTRVRIDGFDFRFGDINGQNTWNHVGARRVLPGSAVPFQPLPNGRIGGEYQMEYKYLGDPDTHKSPYLFEVRQHVELVPGATHLLDTCLVWYTVTNKSKQAHKFGMRVMLDTKIGDNDGVPFTVPGDKNFLTTYRDFSEKEIPESIEAVENPNNPVDLGTIVRMQTNHVRLPEMIQQPEEPTRMYVGHWPGAGALWDDFITDPPTPLMNIYDPEKKKGDSCVVLYWREEEMPPNKTRQFAFTYGLSEMVLSNTNDAAQGNATIMALRGPEQVEVNKDFQISAYVWNGEKGQKVKITLPAGIELAPGEKAEKEIEAGGKERQLVIWKVHAKNVGSQAVEATTRKPADKQEIKLKREVNVTQKTIFG